MKLEQSIAFWKLPREFIMLFRIAGLTTNHQIVNAIGGDISANYTAKGKRMLNIMFSPFDIFTAIIAFAFLPIILLSNLLRGTRTRNSSFKCSPPMALNSIQFTLLFLPSRALLPFLSVLASLFIIFRTMQSIIVIFTIALFILTC